MERVADVTRMNLGADKQAQEIGGGSYGATGSATSPTSTGFTCSGLTASAHVGHLVTLGAVWGVITANTATTVTVDQWYTPGTYAGGAAAPSAGTFIILPAAAPAVFMAIAATGGHSPVVGDTTLLNEGSTAGSGMLRKAATYAHTTSATNYTMTATYTYTSTDNGTTRVYDTIGMFDTLTPVSGIMQFQSSLNFSASLSITGDAVTATQTVNM